MTNTVKSIMHTQLTETEVMVYLLVAKEGKTYRQVASLPFGFTYETAGVTYKKAAEKIQKLVAADILPPEVA